MSFANISQMAQEINEYMSPTVEQTYQNVLGRAPDAEGLAYWNSVFGNKVDPAELESFKQAAKPELERNYVDKMGLPVQPAGNQATTAVQETAPQTPATVEALYQEYLGRAPDASGLAYWQKQFGNSVDANEAGNFLKSAAPELAKTHYNEQAVDVGGTPYAKVEDLYRDVLGRNAEKSGLDYWTSLFGNKIDYNEAQKFRSAAGTELTNRAKANPLDAVALYQTNLGDSIINATPQNIAQYKDLKFAQPEYEAKWIDPATGQPTTDLGKGILAMVEKPRVLDYAASGFTPEKTGQAGKEVTTYRKPVSSLLDAIYDARGNLQGYVASKRAELGNGNYVNAYYDPKGKVNSVYGKITPQKADGGSIGGLNLVRKVS